MKIRSSGETLNSCAFLYLCCERVKYHYSYIVFLFLKDSGILLTYLNQKLNTAISIFNINYVTKIFHLLHLYVSTIYIGAMQF
jgi:hypothetical protein